MERRENTRAAEHIEKLAQFLHNFYERDHITQDGASFSFNNKKSFKRIQFLIEAAYTDTSSLSFSDRNELLELVEKEKEQYIYDSLRIDDLLNNNRSFKIFLGEFNQIIEKIKKQTKREGITVQAQKILKNTLADGGDITDNQTWEKSDLQYIYNTKNSNGSLLLLQNKTGEFLFFNKDTNKIEHICGDQRGKMIEFGQDSKVIVFRQKRAISTETIEQELQQNILTQGDQTLREFLIEMIERYTDKNKPIQDKESFASQVSIDTFSGAISHNAAHIANNLKKAGITQDKHNIFVDNNKSGLKYIGSFDHYNTLEKVAGGYKGKEAVSLRIQDKEKNMVLVTNGDIFDMFNLD